MKRVLTWCDSPDITSGFGKVSRNIIRALDVSGEYQGIIIGVNDWGQSTERHRFKNFRIELGLVVERNVYAELLRTKYLIWFLATQEVDILFTMNDPYVIKKVIGAIKGLKEKKPFKWICYVPIDGEAKEEWFEGWEIIDEVVAYNEFGKEQILKANPNLNVSVIPHGVDTSIFKPKKQEIIDNETKSLFPFMDDGLKIITNINRNSPRKDIDSTLIGYKIFLDKIKAKGLDEKKFLLYLHMQAIDVGGNLIDKIREIGLTSDNVMFPLNFQQESGFTEETVAKIIRASSCLVSTSYGEGVGLSSYEGLACKVPILFPSHTGIEETLADGRGIIIESGSNWNLKVWDKSEKTNNCMRNKVDVYDLANKLLWLFDEQNKEEIEAIKERGYEWIIKREWREIGKLWCTLFKKHATM